MRRSDERSHSHITSIKLDLFYDMALLTRCIKKNRFLIGREKPGTQSEVARLISETLEQEKNQQQQQHLDDHYEHSTEEVSQSLISHENALTQTYCLSCRN